MNWLARRREELQLSQEELVARLQLQGIDIARATLSHWETGRYSIPLDDPELRRALAFVLRISVKELLLAAGYEVDDPYISALMSRAIAILNLLPSEKQKLAVEILETILDNKEA